MPIHPNTLFFQGYFSTLTWRALKKRLATHLASATFGNSLSPGYVWGLLSHPGNGFTSRNVLCLPPARILASTLEWASTPSEGRSWQLQPEGLPFLWTRLSNYPPCVSHSPPSIPGMREDYPACLLLPVCFSGSLRQGLGPAQVGSLENASQTSHVQRIPKGSCQNADFDSAGLCGTGPWTSALLASPRATSELSVGGPRFEGRAWLTAHSG